MEQSYYKVNGVTALAKSGESLKDHQSRQQKEKEEQKKEASFKIETKKEVENPRTTSTLWGIYNLFQEGAIKSEELTGSTIYDLFTMLMQNNKEIDSSLLERYQSLQNGEGISKFSEDNPKRVRKLNVKNYEKYLLSEKVENKK